MFLRSEGDRTRNRHRHGQYPSYRRDSATCGEPAHDFTPCRAQNILAQDLRNGHLVTPPYWWGQLQYAVPSLAGWVNTCPDAWCFGVEGEDMGKPTGFLEYQRELPSDRSPLERVHDWHEFHDHFP